MSNWCMGCHRVIPDGDYCSSCKIRIQWREERRREELTQDLGPALVSVEEDFDPEIPF
jgi:hypothetical protein